jgi:hypothetical protein
MRSDVEKPRGQAAEEEGRTALVTAGALMVGGWLLTIVATVGFHPGGAEDNHPVIFSAYAASGAWVAVHVVQFVGVLLALAGLLVLRTLIVTAGPSASLANLATAAAVATAAVWAALQGLDGVALKQAVDSWAASSGPVKAVRLADAEVIRWLEWGFQSYFRMLLGVTFVLIGAALLMSRVVAGWLGWAAVAAGLLSILIGLDVGYSGLASGVQDVVGIAFLLAGLAFAVGVLVAGLRARRSLAGSRTPGVVAP